MARIFDHPVEFDERQLDLLMRIITTKLARLAAERVDDVVDGADHHIEKRRLPVASK